MSSAQHRSSAPVPSSPTGPGEDEGADAARLERALRPVLDVAQLAGEQLEERVAPANLRALQALELCGSVQVTGLAEAMGMLPSTVSRLSDRLTAAGLITRRPSPRNRRATLLELTEAGRAVLDDLSRAREDALRDALARMDPADARALLRGTAALAHALRPDDPDDAG